MTNIVVVGEGRTAVQRCALWVLPLALACILGCTQQGAQPVGAAPHQIRYRLEWSWGKATALAVDGWEVVTDRGYRVRLTRGYVTSYSMELVECSKVNAPQPLAGLGDLIPQLFGVGIAYAGHSAGTPNPAAITTPRVESLVKPEPSEASPSLRTPEKYCRAYYLVARATNVSTALPRDVDMVDASLHVEGTYAGPAAREPVAFTIHTAIANGLLTDLYPPGRFRSAPDAFQFSTAESGARVIIRRNLGALFDGIAFDATPARLIERQVLKDLIDSTEIEVERVP